MLRITPKISSFCTIVQALGLDRMSEKSSQIWQSVSIHFDKLILFCLGRDRGSKTEKQRGEEDQNQHSWHAASERAGYRG